MKIPLSDGAYQTKSIIASAQRCVNLYMEVNPEDLPFPTTHYLTPGTNLLAEGPSENPVRCTFRSSNGDLYAVIDDTVYYYDSAFVRTTIGVITSDLTTPVSMQDNGNVILICDGTPDLWAIDMVTRNFAQVIGTNFFGGTRVDYLDTYFLLNVPDTNRWYISLSNVTFEMLTSPIGSILTGSILNAGNTGAIKTGSITTSGSSYNNGTYTDIPLFGGSGSGATANLTIAGGSITVVTINSEGINYVVDNLLTINTSFLSVASTGTYTFTTNPTNNQTIILNGVTWTFKTSGATGTQTNIGATTADTLTQLAIDLNASTNNSLVIATYAVSPTVLTITYNVGGVVGNAYTLAAGTYAGVISGATLAGGVDGTGSGFVYNVDTIGGTYPDGVYFDVPLVGGSGFNARATITVTDGVVVSVVITDEGNDYLVGDILGVDGEAQGTYTFTTNPMDTQTIILNGVTWTFVNSGATGTQTNIGASLNITLASLATNLNASSNTSINVATYTIFDDSILNIKYDTAGVVGNAYTLAAGTVGGTVSSATLTGGTDGEGSGFSYIIEGVGGGAFDALDIATKNGYPDAIVALIVMHREIWIIGRLTTEVWYNSGAADFTFQNLPGTFIEHGCIAKYSICKQDLSVYWLSQDEQGQAIVMKGSEYTARRISTFALENEFASYATIEDAIGFTYQQEGHTFLVMIFPTANKTWVFDESNNLWHQRAWTDNEGNLNRHRMNCICNAYNKNIIGDWQNGNLYQLNLDQITDYVDGEGPNTNGTYPITRIRSWPALINEGRRVSHQSFIADMEVGMDNNDLDGTNPPLVSLRWSDDRGRTYGNALEQNLGEQGDYLAQPSWNRLGMSRGRVYELSWSTPTVTALNGAWVEATPAAS